MIGILWVVAGGSPDEIGDNLLNLVTPINMLIAALLVGGILRRQTSRVLGLCGVNGIHFLLLVGLVLPLNIVALEVGTIISMRFPAGQHYNLMLDYARSQPWLVLLFFWCVLPGLG